MGFFVFLKLYLKYLEAKIGTHEQDGLFGHNPLQRLVSFSFSPLKAPVSVEHSLEPPASAPFHQTHDEAAELPDTGLDEVERVLYNLERVLESVCALLP